MAVAKITVEMLLDLMTLGMTLGGQKDVKVDSLQMTGDGYISFNLSGPKGSILNNEDAISISVEKILSQTFRIGIRPQEEGDRTSSEVEAIPTVEPMA